MKKLELDKKMAELDRQMSLKSRNADLNRIRSFAIGTAFGGITEINVRVNDGTSYWGLFQPVEVIELIHQLAANIGCHIHIQPRRDFGAWRDWKYTEEEMKWFRGEQSQPGIGWPPYTKGWHENQQVATSLPPPEQQPGLKFESNENEPVPIEKPIKQKNIKKSKL